MATRRRQRTDEHIERERKREWKHSNGIRTHQNINIHLQIIIILIHVLKDWWLAGYSCRHCHIAAIFIIIFSATKKSYFNFIRRTIYRVIKSFNLLFRLCVRRTSHLCKSFPVFFCAIPFVPSLLRRLRQTHTKKKLENKENLSLVERQKRLGWKSKFILYARQKMGKRYSNDVCENVAKHARNR